MSNNDLILSKEETKKLLSSLKEPDIDVIRKRNLLLDSFDTMHIVNHGASTVVVEIADLCLPDITQKLIDSEIIVLKSDCLQISLSSSVEINYSVSSHLSDLDIFNNKEEYHCIDDEKLYVASIPSGFAA